MHTRHFLQLIALSALWGGSFPLLRIASPALGPWLLAGLRCLLAALVLTLLMRLLREQWPPRSAWPRLGLLSLLTVVAPFIQLGSAGDTCRLFSGAQCHGAAVWRAGCRRCA